MRNAKFSVLLLLFAGLLSACVSGRRVVDSTPVIAPSDTVIARSYLDSLHQEIARLLAPPPDTIVELAMHRLARPDTLSIIGVGDIMIGTNYPHPTWQSCGILRPHC